MIITNEQRKKFVHRINCVAATKWRWCTGFPFLNDIQFRGSEENQDWLGGLRTSSTGGVNQASYEPPKIGNGLTLPREVRRRGITVLQALYISQRQNLKETKCTVCKTDHGFRALHMAQKKFQLNCNVKAVDEKSPLDYIDKAALNTWLVRIELLFSEAEGFDLLVRCRKCNSIRRRIKYIASNYATYLLRHNKAVKIGQSVCSLLQTSAWSSCGK